MYVNRGNALVDDKGYHAPDAGRRRTRPEDRGLRQKVNHVVFDRWRGWAVLILPLISGAIAAMGFQLMTPAKQLQALQADIRRLDARVDTLVSMDRKLELLLRLQCRELTASDLALIGDDFACRR